MLLLLFFAPNGITYNLDDWFRSICLLKWAKTCEILRKLVIMMICTKFSSNTVRYNYNRLYCFVRNLYAINKSYTTQQKKKNSRILLFHFTHISFRYMYTLFISFTISLIESNGKEIIVTQCGSLLWQRKTKQNKWNWNPTKWYTHRVHSFECLQMNACMHAWKL